MTAAVLQLEGIEKRFPGVHALRSVSFRVAEGSVHALVGENGAGKSTLISVVSGALAPDGGRMELAGAPFAPRDPLAALAAGIATVYQQRIQLPHRTVAANVLLGVEPRRLSVLLDRAAMRATVRELLGRLDAPHISPDALVRDLNVADRQLVDIAKALHRQARLLILDEPTAALSAQETDALFGVIESLRAGGVAVLLVSHRMDDVFRASDAVTVLRDGAHILTRPAGELDPDALVAAMIGRKLETAYPPSTTRAERPVIVRARGLTGTSFAGVDLDVRAGEVLALAGLSGSGKEELGMALGGASATRGGVLEVDGRPRRLSPRRARGLGLACVPADRRNEGVIEDLSVRRNVALASLEPLTGRLGLIRRQEEARLATRQRDALSLRAAGLEVPVRELSGGNQQKVALGKWLAIAPRVLVLVEPTQGIDVGVRFELYHAFRALTEQGKAIVLVSSDVSEVLGMADRVVVMRNGGIAGQLAGSEASEEAILRLALGEPTTNPTTRSPTG